MQNKNKFDEMMDTFRTSYEETLKKCPSESEKLRRLVIDSLLIHLELPLSEKFRISLMDMRIIELFRLMTHAMYLSMSGLYRNAFDNIRYILESTLQSLYIDSRHPNSSLRTRIEILKEVEDKREYRAINLIDELQIDHKDALKKEYKRLSQTIHPSHRNIIEVLDFTQKSLSNELLVAVSCKEISDVCESIKIMFDMVLFLYVSCAPRTRKEKLQSDKNLVEYCKKYNMVLLSKILKAHLSVKKNEK